MKYLYTVFCCTNQTAFSNRDVWNLERKKETWQCLDIIWLVHLHNNRHRVSNLNIARHCWRSFIEKCIVSDEIVILASYILHLLLKFRHALLLILLSDGWCWRVFLFENRVSKIHLFLLDKVLSEIFIIVHTPNTSTCVVKKQNNPLNFYVVIRTEINLH